jgi:hypothetical protein
MAGEPSAARRALDLLRSQGLGVACGLVTVTLLAVGSVVMAATRDTVSAAIAMDDVRAFFAPPRLAHAWLYLLVPVLALYGLTTLLATWTSVSQRWRSGQRSAGALGPSVVHLSFLVAMVAHLVGGFWGAEQGVAVVGAAWGALPDGRQGRLAAFSEDKLPSGATRQVSALLHLRDAGGTERQEVLAYNAPITAGWGRSLLLLVQHASQPGAVSLSSEGVSCTAETGGPPCVLGETRVQLTGLRPMGQRGVVVAFLLLTGPDGRSRDGWLVPGRTMPLDERRTLALDHVEDRPVVVVRGRAAPGNPVALLAAVLLALGLTMMARRFWAARPRRAPARDPLPGDTTT